MPSRLWDDARELAAFRQGSAADLHAVGYGKRQPKNKADVFAPENRRVEIVNETPRAQ